MLEHPDVTNQSLVPIGVTGDDFAGEFPPVVVAVRPDVRAALDARICAFADDFRPGAAAGVDLRRRLIRCNDDGDGAFRIGHVDDGGRPELELVHFNTPAETSAGVELS